MDEFSNGYFPDENYNGPALVEGDYRGKIVDVKSTQTRNGDPMLDITIVVAESTIKFHHRIVKNEYFNSNMTKCFDTFGIPRGNFDYARWQGRMGMLHIAKGKPNDQGKAYMEIAYLIVPPKNNVPNALSPQQRPAPVAARTPAPAAAPAPYNDDFPDDVPGF